MNRATNPQKHAKTRKVIFATATACALLLGFSAPARADVPEGGIANSVYKFVASPDTSVGTNDWNCKPTAEHPNPVILIPGTFFNHGATFVKMAPRLKNSGYCVFALNYGFTPASLGRMSGLAPVESSVAELAAFVDRVRTATGASKVDMIGWSQGGLLPIAYIKQAGGGDKVAHYVGWAQSSNGTTGSGLDSLSKAIGALGFIPPQYAVLNAQGVQDQFAGSPFITNLASIPLPAGPKYTSIFSTYDELLPPYTNGVLPAPAHNVHIQDYCPFDLTGHIGMYLDDPTLQFTMNALNDGPSNFRPSCRGYGTPFL